VSHLGALATHHKQLEIWAANCAENFEDRAVLVGAEIARLEGRELEGGVTTVDSAIRCGSGGISLLWGSVPRCDAEHLYEQAIRSARANGFVHKEALANELAAPGPDRAIWAVYPPKKVVSPKVKAFHGFLAERFGQPPYWDRP